MTTPGQPVTPPADPRLGIAAPHPPPEGSLVLLYIEDNAASVEVMKAVLDLCPAWRLIHSGLVATGIDVAHAHHPDLILVDMHLPDGSGAHVLTTLKAHPETRDIPVVVVTAGATTTSATSLLQAGADQFWTKPHDLNLMLAYFDHIATRPVNPVSGNSATRQVPPW
ncbi:MAG: response regulator [Actinomycetota bacterium]|nr:response regulator [Actinomycetota bacterium]